MSTTFYVSLSPLQLSLMLASRHFRCRVERMTVDSCNITFLEVKEVERFELWAEENEVDYTLV